MTKNRINKIDQAFSTIVFFGLLSPLLTQVVMLVCLDQIVLLNNMRWYSIGIIAVCGITALSITFICIGFNKLEKALT